MCRALSVCSAWRSCRPVNPLLPGLNAGIGVLDPSNFYVIYGTDPSPANSIVNDTDVVFDVKPGTRTLTSGWQNGEPERRFTTTAGDDLIPEYSSNLKLLLPGIDPSHVAGFRVQNGVTQFGLSGPAFRHKEIMWSRELQAQYAPNWLAGLGPIPFYQPYVQPDVVEALARGAGWALFGECPVNLLLTDLQRNLKLGYDPDTGIVYRDIPNSTYAAPNTESQFMLLGELPPGTYHLKVSAFADGKFSLSLNQLDMAGTPRRWLAEDTVHTGEVREYDIVIGPQPPITRQPPIADAGPDQTVPAVPPACVADVQLDGSRSSDPDGEVLTYQWTGVVRVCHRCAADGAVAGGHERHHAAGAGWSASGPARTYARDGDGAEADDQFTQRLAVDSGTGRWHPAQRVGDGGCVGRLRNCHVQDRRRRQRRGR